MRSMARWSAAPASRRRIFGPSPQRRGRRDVAARLTRLAISGGSAYISGRAHRFDACAYMILLLFVVHVLIALALIGVIMLQKSEGGALGMGGGGMSGFMTGRSTANLLTRTTAVLAGLFFLTSIALVMLSNAGRAPRSLVDEAPSGPVAPLSPAAPQV